MGSNPAGRANQSTACRDAGLFRLKRCPLCAPLPGSLRPEIGTPGGVLQPGREHPRDGDRRVLSLRSRQDLTHSSDVGSSANDGKRPCADCPCARKRTSMECLLTAIIIGSRRPGAADPDNDLNCRIAAGQRRRMHNERSDGVTLSFENHLRPRTRVRPVLSRALF